VHAHRESSYAAPVVPWSFVGRADELNRLIAAASSGTGRGLIFSGTAGIGKSRLLREGVAALPTERFAVWGVAANIATAGLPFGGLAQVLPADQPVGLSPAGLLRWAVDALHQQAAGRPIVLAIDDAHLLDASSAALVYLIARSEQATVIGTLRSGESVPLPIRALWTDDLVEHAELQPLTAHDSAALLAEMLGGPIDSNSAERLWRLSAGNALLLRELVIAAHASEEITSAYGLWRWTGRLELAPTLTDLIDTRIGGLDRSVRTSVELVAFGEPIGLPLLVKATDELAVEAAEERGLIRIVRDGRRVNARLAHPLYGEVVRRQCPVSRARRLLATLAALVEDAGARRRDDLLRVAVWRLDSDTAQDPSLLLGAGAQAFASFDVPLASRLARAALAARGGFDAAELLATILMFADRPQEAIAVIEAAHDEVTSDARRSHWLTVYGLLANWGLGRDGIADKLRAGAALISDPGERARVHSFEAIMRLHRLESAEALRLARSVLDRPAASTASRALARCVTAHLQATRGELARSARTVAAVQADAPQWRPDMPYVQLALELARGTRLILSGDLAGVDAIVADEFADLADAGDFRIGSGYLAIVRSQAARLRGQSVEALRCAVQASAALVTSRVFASLAHAERAHAAALRGDAALAAEAMADSDERHEASLEILYPWREQARCWVAACAGDIETALEVLNRLLGRLCEDGFAGHEVFAQYDLVRLGRADLAADRLGVLAEVVDGPLAKLMARHARAAADGDGPELLAVSGALADLGLYQYAAEAAAMAVARLRSERLPLAAAAGAQLASLLDGRVDARTPPLLATRPTLTGRERQVARLAALGVPSRAIADQLFLSPRTVDNHLLRVYAKLGIAGRSELATALRALPELSTPAEPVARTAPMGRRRGGNPTL
jgi:DNA-binding CsgD family transcriptional regulator